MLDDKDMDQIELVDFDEDDSTDEAVENVAVEDNEENSGDSEKTTELGMGRPDKKMPTKKRNGQKTKGSTNQVIRWVGRVLATIGLTLVLLCVGLYAVMAMLVYGPSKTAKEQFVMSVQETSAIGFLANWFCSKEEVQQIKDNNSVKDSGEITDASLVTVGSAVDNAEIPDLQVIDIKGGTYRGKLMIVKDPSRVFVGTVNGFKNGEGEVVSTMAQRNNAIAGVNGGEFVDGTTTYTAMPVGLVMVNGEVLNGNSGTSYHVTGITNDNKLVLGNMSAQQAKEKNIRDCVSISNEIGPFLVINGEAQEVSGIGGGNNPRTAIGQKADGSILLLVVDGRQVDSLGASFSDLQDIMIQYGAVNASTMDGGTSTQMYYNGSVINTPYSPTGPRSCPTSFLVK